MKCVLHDDMTKSLPISANKEGKGSSCVASCSSGTFLHLKALCLGTYAVA